jgi:SPP1 gp7 family putative phage head morphogenesis protein
MDKELEELLNQQTIVAGVEMMGGYSETLAVVGAGVPGAVGIAVSQADEAAMSYWMRRWTLPALQNTLNGFREKILDTFDRMNTNGKNWAWASSEMRRMIDPTGNKYPKGFYQRIARTETRRVVESAHISGLSKAGIQFVERLVVEDATTDKDLCSPFDGTIYRVDQATGILPAHPNCRCTLVGYIGTPDDVNTDPLKPIIPQPKAKRVLTVADRTPPQGVRNACKTGIKLHEDGLSGSGLEGATVREANAMIRGQPITVAKAKKMIRWWGRNARFLDEPKDSPAWVAALLWGGRAGLSWSRKLSRALEAEE